MLFTLLYVILEFSISGKMASNGKILLNNSSITNIGEILSGESFYAKCEKI